MPQLVIAPLATAFGFASGSLGFALLSAGVQLAFAFTASALFGSKISATETARDLTFPASLPYYRFVYGTTRADCTVLPHPVIGSYGYGVYLLNSRPSVGTPTLYLDGREIPLTGDPYDFTGSGAVPSSGDLVNHLQVWIGLGDQSGPPDEYISECPYDETDQPLGFRSTDAGEGCTVVYLKYYAGATSSISDRWPNVPPAAQVEGLRTAVYDMREVSHDPDDETTWEGTSNHALNTLDVIRNNPFRPYPDAQILFDMFEEAANIADETVAVAAGGSEARYTVDGTVIFDGTELQTILTPLYEAGAAEPVWLGGKLGIAPGEASTEVMTVTDVLDGVQFSNMTTADDLPTEIRTTYISAARSYAEADLAPYAIPGVGDAEAPNTLAQSLPYTTSATRAMRLRAIKGSRVRQQAKLDVTLPPSAMQLTRRSGVNVDLGAAWDGVVNGSYEVESMHPAAYLLGDDGGWHCVSPQHCDPLPPIPMTGQHRTRKKSPIPHIAAP